MSSPSTSWIYDLKNVKRSFSSGLHTTDWRERVCVSRPKTIAEEKMKIRREKTKLKFIYFIVKEFGSKGIYEPKMNGEESDEEEKNEMPIDVK